MCLKGQFVRKVLRFAARLIKVSINVESISNKAVLNVHIMKAGISITNIY